MSRATENKEEILKIHGCIDLINQRIDTIENNHLKHIQKSIHKLLKNVVNWQTDMHLPDI